MSYLAYHSRTGRSMSTDTTHLIDPTPPHPDGLCIWPGQVGGRVAWLAMHRNDYATSHADGLTMHDTGHVKSASAHTSTLPPAPIQCIEIPICSAWSRLASAEVNVRSERPSQALASSSSSMA